MLSPMKLGLREDKYLDQGHTGRAGAKYPALLSLDDTLIHFLQHELHIVHFIGEESEPLGK